MRPVAPLMTGVGSTRNPGKAETSAFEIATPPPAPLASWKAPASSLPSAVKFIDDVGVFTPSIEVGNISFGPALLPLVLNCETPPSKFATYTLLPSGLNLMSFGNARPPVASAKIVGLLAAPVDGS